MTLMSSSNDSDFQFLPPVGDGPQIQAPSKTMVRVAGGVIVVLAGLGLVRGVLDSRPANPSASPLAVLTGMSPAASAAAKPAVILPRDNGWSTLSGPQMIDAKAKPAVEAKPIDSADDEQADSESPAAATVAADAAAPTAPVAVPPAAPSIPAASAAASSAAPAPQ